MSSGRTTLVRTLALALHLFSAGIFSAGCGAVDVPRATLLDSQRSGVLLEDLEHGRVLYLSKCTSCHSAVGPRTLPASAWPDHVAEMAERAGLTAPEHRLIVTYLTTVATAPPATR